MPSIDPQALTWFIASAKPGDRLEYHRGRLDRDLSGLDRRSPMRIVRRLAQKAQASELFDLIQQRHAPDDYSYLIRRRRRSSDQRRYG